jgi:hypothetical protein
VYSCCILNFHFEFYFNFDLSVSVLSLLLLPKSEQYQSLFDALSERSVDLQEPSRFKNPSLLSLYLEGRDWAKVITE